MDLPLFLRVLWRFRFLVAFGVALALALALLAYVRVGFSGNDPTFSYREKEQWKSEALLFITQAGFPWGRSVLPIAGETPTVVPESGTTGAVTGKKEPEFANPARFGDLATLYATLATSNPVREIIRAEAPIDGTIEAAPVLSTDTLAPDLKAQLRYATALPLLRITAKAAEPARAQRLAGREVDAFLQFLREQQQAGAVPPKDRVMATVLEAPREPELAKGRSKIYPVLVFVGVLTATLALAFVLENAVPRRPQSTAQEEQRIAAVSETSRRSA